MCCPHGLQGEGNRRRSPCRGPYSGYRRVSLCKSLNSLLRHSRPIWQRWHLFSHETHHRRKEFLAVAVLLPLVPSAVAVKIIDDRVLFPAGFIIAWKDYPVMPHFIERKAVMSLIIEILDLGMEHGRNNEQPHENYSDNNWELHKFFRFHSYFISWSSFYQCDWTRTGKIGGLLSIINYVKLKIFTR